MPPIPPDVAIGLALICLLCGILIGWAFPRRQPRLPSSAYCPPRKPVEPVMAEWTPEHGRAVAARRVA